VHSSTRNLRRAFSGPAGLRRTLRALSVRPGFVGPAGLCRAGRASSGPARHFAARTPKARLIRPGRARAGSDRLLHESGYNDITVFPVSPSYLKQVWATKNRGLILLRRWFWVHHVGVGGLRLD